MSTSARIQLIDSLVHSPLVYDLCCDHGLIGLLSLKAGREVVFVDKVTQIIQQLETRLQSLKRWSTSCQDILELTFVNKPCTLILCGVGGSLAAKFIAQFNFQEGHELIVSAHNNQHLVIESIAKAKLKRVQDFLIEDQKRSYEIFLCQWSPQGEARITANRDFINYTEGAYFKKQLLFMQKGAPGSIRWQLFQEMKALLP